VGVGLGLAVLVGVGVAVIANARVVAGVVVAPRNTCAGVALATWVACTTDGETGGVVVDNMTSTPK